MIEETIVYSSEAGSTSVSREPAWKVLVVDDESDVHDTTVLALDGFPVEDREVQFLHAYTAFQARQLLQSDPDIAVILLDVVMESDNAGLELVRHIRDELNNRTIRIILRTGQPGFAPEIQTIRSYDINDYKSKAHTRSVDLFTSLATAIRSYHQIKQLEANRNGLELIVKATAEFIKPKGLGLLAQGIVSQLCVLLGLNNEGLVCASAGLSSGQPRILAAAGEYANWVGQDLKDVPDPVVRDILEQVFSKRENILGEITCLYFASALNHAMVAYIRVARALSDIERNLLEVFCGNIAIAFDNAELYQKISDIAFEDPLTRLPNRNGLLRLIDERKPIADTIALLDVDGFSDVNSVLDQAFGDSVLRALATRIRQNFSSGVGLARVGGDVFALLGPSEEVNDERIAALFNLPLVVGQESLRISLTSGVAKIDNAKRISNDVLQEAAVALKQAKVLNRGKSVTFEPALAAAARDRMQMLNRLREALTAERLFVVYQPFVNLVSTKVVGAEALIRWRTEEGVFVPPDRFIPIAEQSGMMVPIGDWVMRSAFRFAHRLVQLGHRDFRMAINVSHVQFREPDFIDNLLSAIRIQGLDPRNVEVELTESVAVDDVQLIKSKLSSLRSNGVAIAIDDFGTGYSSLNIIRQLPVNRLKIDRAFVSGSAAQEGDYGIAETVLNLAKHLKLETIAEGVETPEQHRKLLALGCEDGQGYLFSRPLAEQDFEQFLRKSIG